MQVSTTKGRTLNGSVETLPFINPATNEQFGEVHTATGDDVARARREMAAVAPEWAARPLQDRIRLLQKLQAVIIDDLDEITAIINQDNGKSRQDALIEIFVTVDLMTQYAKNAPHWLRRRSISPGLQIFKRCYVERKPHGVVAVIAPWNYPFVLMVPPLISALLAGNSVIAKPSEVTAATGVMVEKLFQRVPDLARYVRFLHGDGRVGAAIVASNPDLIYVTGSVATGQKIQAAAAENLTPVICELGSKDPMLVLEDADIEAAAKWGVWGAFYNSGQTCVSVERVYVVEAVYDAFLAAVLQEVEKIQVGFTQATESHFNIGPLTHPAQLKIVDDHLQDAVAKGAVILAGGQQEGMFMQPTVVVNVDHAMKLMQDETFGPVMPIMKVENETHAVQLANHSYMGLGASVWSRNLERAEAVAHRLETGSVNINDTITHFAIPTLPFGGVKLSGSGRSHGEEDLLQFTSSRSYVVGKGPHPLDIATLLRRPGTYRLNKSILKLAFGVSPQQRLEPVKELLADAQHSQKAQITVAAGLTTAVAAIITAAVATAKLRKYLS